MQISCEAGRAAESAGDGTLAGRLSAPEAVSGATAWDGRRWGDSGEAGLTPESRGLASTTETVSVEADEWLGDYAAPIGSSALLQASVRYSTPSPAQPGPRLRSNALRLARGVLKMHASLALVLPGTSATR